MRCHGTSPRWPDYKLPRNPLIFCNAWNERIILKRPRFWPPMVSPWFSICNIYFRGTYLLSIYILILIILYISCVLRKEEWPKYWAHAMKAVNVASLLHRLSSKLKFPTLPLVTFQILILLVKFQWGHLDHPSLFSVESFVSLLHEHVQDRLLKPCSQLMSYNPSMKEPSVIQGNQGTLEDSKESQRALQRDRSYQQPTL